MARAYLFAHAPLVTNVQGLSEAKCQEAQALIRVYKRIDDAAFRDATLPAFMIARQVGFMTTAAGRTPCRRSRCNSSQCTP